MATTKVVLLRKMRKSATDWAYLVGHESTVFTTNGGPIVEQFIDVVEDIKDNHVGPDEKLLIITRAFSHIIAVEAKELYPEVTFLKLSDAAQAAAFLKAFSAPAPAKRGQSRTLFIGSDASGGHEGTICAWAWCTNGKNANYSMGICEFRDINISEFEGILRAIIENQDTKFDRIHVYSDSKNAIDFYNRGVVGNEVLNITEGNYLADLVTEARQVINRRHVTVEWVRGHRSHRLNTAADVISRHARMSAQSGKNIRQMQEEADVMFSIFRR
jgi:ribonuclease HI